VECLPDCIPLSVDPDAGPLLAMATASTLRSRHANQASTSTLSSDDIDRSLMACIDKLAVHSKLHYRDEERVSHARIVSKEIKLHKQAILMSQCSTVNYHSHKQNTTNQPTQATIH